jgi:archaellum component FlaG (FlaF/FlaG flagellin family)
MNRQRRRLHLETLEARSLLSGLTYSLTTDQSTYSAGQLIQMTLTATNTSDEPIELPIAASDDGFIVSQNGQTVWQSNAGNNPTNIGYDDLQPGQSYTLQETWGGTIASGSSVTTTTGSFVVTNQMAPQSTSASFQIQSPLAYTLNVPQQTYQFGQPIDLSYTITNTSDQTVTFDLSSTDFVVTLQQDGSTVWESAPGAASQPSTSQTLQPGQTLTETAIWKDLANEGVMAGTDVWDSFGVSLLGGPPGLTQQFLIDSPLTQHVTTQEIDGPSGEQVQMTATETNTSDQTVTILNINDQFNVQGYGGPVLPATDISSTNPVATLQPGQSQTFTATWNTSTSTTPVGGYYNVLFQDHFQGATSPQFELGSSSNSSTGATTDPPASSSQSPSQVASPPSTSAQAASSIIATVATSRPKIEAGHPVHLTITVTNTTKQRVDLAAILRDARITVLNGSTVVSEIRKIPLARKDATLKAGQSLRIAAVWDEKSNSSSREKLEAGTYSIDVDGADFEASTTITVKDHR